MTTPKKFKKYPLVLIEWYDHAGEGGWVEIKDLEDPPILAKTVGWLVKEDNLRRLTKINCVIFYFIKFHFITPLVYSV